MRIADVCDSSAFAALYRPIAREIARHSPLTAKTLSATARVCPLGGFGILIRNRTVYTHRVSSGYETRAASMLMLFYTALSDPAFVSTLSDTDFWITCHDTPPGDTTLPLMALARRRPPNSNAPAVLAVPDFTFWSYPETRIGPYDRALRLIAEATSGLSLVQRTEKVFWRGNRCDRRDALFDWGRRHPSIDDIAACRWEGPDKLCPNYVSMPDACRRRYLVHSIGRQGSYSSRLKYYMACGSVPLVPQNMEFEEWWYHLLEPWVNHVPINDDIEASIRAAMELPLDRQESIARNASTLIRNTVTRQGAICYIRRLVSAYAAATVSVPPLPSGALLLDDALALNIRPILKWS